MEHLHSVLEMCNHHELKHCPVCDVVLCERCGREWGFVASTYTITFPDYPQPHTGDVLPTHPYTACQFSGDKGEEK